MQHKKLGLWTLTALCAGNMIGSGIFLLPSSLAAIGSIGLLSWLFTVAGAICLALTFSYISALVPKTGGPYAYAKAGFGHFIGFQTAYGYWIALWVGNAAIAIACASYLTVFFPILDNPLYSCLAAIALVWIFTFVNVLGVREAGIFQLITTILKLIPLLFVGIAGWWYFDPENITQYFNISGKSNLSAFAYGATLTLWAFIGVESASIPASSIENPEKLIPRATMLGVMIAAVVYIVSSCVIMGMIPAPTLQHSSSPFALAAGIIIGDYGRWLIAVGAVISCIGTLNGWVLLQGQVAMAAADDQLFPKIFARRNRHQVPTYGMMITSVLISIILLLTINKSLVKHFELMILIAVVASLTQIGRAHV